MNHLKTIGFAALVAMALTAFAAAGTASATTLEVEKTAQNKSVGFTLSLKSGTSTSFSRTDGSLANVCLQSEFNGNTVKDENGDFTGPTVNATFLEAYFAECTRPVTIDKAGIFAIEWIKGTTNGTVHSLEAEVTVGTVLGTITCKTGTGVDIGAITGVATGKATLHINAVLGCGLMAPSVKWVGTYEFTSPNGLGVIE